MRHRPSLLAPLVALVSAALAGPTGAAVPTYGPPVLQARANFSGAYNLPDGAFFTSETPQLNDVGDLACRLVTVPGTDAQGVWFGGSGSGALVYTGPAGSFLSGVTVNDAGLVVFELTYTSPNGLYAHDTATGSSGIVTNLPFGATGWGSPRVNDAGEIGYRASFSGAYAWVSWDGVSQVATHVADATLDLDSPYSYLFTPSFNDARQIAGKVRLGPAGQVGEERPDQVRVFAADGSSTLIAEDRDSNPASPWVRFDNSVWLTPSGRVAFVAEDQAGDRTVVLSDGVTTVVVASEADAEVGDVESFGVAANDAGLVAFRAFDGAGLRAIFVGDGTTLVRAIGEHDPVLTDLGPGRVDQHDSSPVFGGSPALDAAGNLACNAALTPADDNQVEWGSGLLRVPADGALFADGFETGGTLEWSATAP